jgi:hypothetical protein
MIVKKDTIHQTLVKVRRRRRIFEASSFAVEFWPKKG